MKRAEQQRTTRRVLIVGLAISALAHAAALAWLGLPIRMPAASATIALLPPLAEPAPRPVAAPPEITAQATAAVADAGGSGAQGGAPARPAPESGAPVERATPSQLAEAAPDAVGLAAVDSLPVHPTMPAATMPAAATMPTAAAETAAPQPAARPASHTPGSVGGAKDRWAGTSPGSAGAGNNNGRGGIGIKVGRGGIKRHPPMGVPGRGRGGVLW